MHPIAPTYYKISSSYRHTLFIVVTQIPAIWIGTSISVLRTMPLQFHKSYYLGGSGSPVQLRIGDGSSLPIVSFGSSTLHTPTRLSHALQSELQNSRIVHHAPSYSPAKKWICWMEISSHYWHGPHRFFAHSSSSDENLRSCFWDDHVSHWLLPTKSLNFSSPF